AWHPSGCPSTVAHELPRNPRPAISAFTRVFDALWRGEGGERRRREPGGGGQRAPSAHGRESRGAREVPPTPPPPPPRPPLPLPPLRFAPRGEGRTLRCARDKDQRRPNRRSRNQPSRPRSMGCGRTAWAPNGLPACGLNWPAIGAGGSATFGSAEASHGAAESPGSAATATPRWGNFIKRDPMATGRPPPGALLVGGGAAVPSPAPPTGGPGVPRNQ